MKLEFVKTEAYNMVSSIYDDVVKVIDNEEIPQNGDITASEALEILKSVEDDSSWEDIDRVAYEKDKGTGNFDVIAEYTVRD